VNWRKLAAAIAKNHRRGGGSFVMILYAKSSAPAGLFVSSRGSSICKKTAVLFTFGRFYGII
jgi:hypothetical protein